MTQPHWWMAILPLWICACTHDGAEPEVPRPNSRLDGAGSTKPTNALASSADVRSREPVRPRQERLLGRTAPSLDAALKTAETELPNWAALRGRVVVLEFWSPWCGICHLVHDRLNAWSSRWSNTSVQVLSVVALPKEDARRAAARHGLRYVVLSDPEEITFRDYDIFAVPSLFLIDRKGAVVDVMTGYSSERLARIEGRITELVAAH